MPVEWAIIAWNDVATTQGRLATGIAENSITFGVSCLPVVRDILVVIADAASFAAIESACCHHLGA